MADLTRFLACWPDVLAQECPFPDDWGNLKNFSNDPHDPGGATMDGVTQGEFDRYLAQNGLPPNPVLYITQEEGQQIYYNSYWMPYCPSLPIGLDLQVFDSSVNEGPVEAIRILQVALGIDNDGIWGPQTASAILGIANVGQVIDLFTARRKLVYTETTGFQYFGTDWIRRATEIGDEAEAMASTGLTQRFYKMPFKRSPRAYWYLPKERR
jgi:lysozyme family protein